MADGTHTGAARPGTTIRSRPIGHTQRTNEQNDSYVTTQPTHTGTTVCGFYRKLAMAYEIAIYYECRTCGLLMATADNSFANHYKDTAHWAPEPVVWATKSEGGEYVNEPA
jgi:hypothetical protein